MLLLLRYRVPRILVLARDPDAWHCTQKTDELNTYLMVRFFVFKKPNTQREPAIPADVAISKSALYSRIGTADAESTTALLYPQQDIDAALRLARAEVTFCRIWKRKSVPLVASFFPVSSHTIHATNTCSVLGTLKPSQRLPKQKVLR